MNKTGRNAGTTLGVPEITKGKKNAFERRSCTRSSEHVAEDVSGEEEDTVTVALLRRRRR